MHRFVFLPIILLSFVAALVAQSPSATINGLVLDPSGATVAGAEIVVVNDATRVQYATRTNGEGIYVVPNLPPGSYRIQVSYSGFKTIIKPDIVIHVQDALSINFTLPIGAASEIVTVKDGAPLVNTENAAVSTIIDREFVENMPLNGRSFNTLLQLTPGVVIVANNGNEGGQFSVNGQRANANYFAVDGVSVNFAVGVREFMTQAGSGTTQAFSAFGGTSSLVSVDAMQEFRVDTSSFAAEFGRTPGGQVIINTRSGTNNFHGALFNYFRNDVLDANDWFANAAGKPRAAERQNDFGGVFGGPLHHEKTFFFFSYEGLRLRQPTTTVVRVPSVGLRSAAIPAAAVYLDAYPLPDAGAAVSADGTTSQFTGNYSNPVTLNATSLRIDHTFSRRLSVFGRYNWAPSESRSRQDSLSEIQAVTVNTDTLTLGANSQIKSNLFNSLRVNYSMQKGGTDFLLDSLGGATSPPASAFFPAPFSPQDGTAFFFPLSGPRFYGVGQDARNETSQWNVVDDFAIAKGPHQIKFGVDYRRILLGMGGLIFAPEYFVLDLNQFASTAIDFGTITTALHPGQASFRSFSAYAQDRISLWHRLTLTYGLRWEANPAPSGQNGTVLSSWENTENPASTVLAPAGTSPWSTTYGNFAPRLGVAYRLTPDGTFVVRGGWGIFYDLGSGVASNLLGAYPNNATLFTFSTQLPVTNAAPLTPSFSTGPPYAGADIRAFDANLRLPYSYQWNVAVEKSFAGEQSLSVTYAGQAGRRLLRTEQENAPNSNFAPGTLFAITRNGDTSDYDALQVQFRRAMARRIQALVSYSWSHSIDTNSDDSLFLNSFTVIPTNGDRGSSDFDIRHNLSGALIYDLPGSKSNLFLKKISEGWSLATTFQARTGFPVQVVTTSIPIPGLVSSARPDVVPDQHIWLHGPQYPGGMALNPSAFTLPPVPRQGTLGRNSIYGFGATEFDTSLQRKFNITERASLLTRVDAFNIFNHPNFANPIGTFSVVNGSPTFPSSDGESARMLNQGLRGLNPLYQTGGPRSLQLSLKLVF